jgi:pilus assembly protein CpaE
MRRSAGRGQASVELLGSLPVILVLGVACFQLLAVGYSAVLAGNAAEAGALALVGGGDAAEAARGSLPGWSRARGRVEVGGGRVRVRLRPPSPLRALSRELEVHASAEVER